MNTIVFVSLASVALASAIATAPSADVQPAAAARVIESAAIAVDSDTSVTEHAGVWTAPVTVITARRPHAQKADCGAFQFRSLVQGTGTVRGFCL